MDPSTKQRLRLSGGTDLSFVSAGDASSPTVLLIHGFRGSGRSACRHERARSGARLIVQNANAHRTGLGPPWAPTMAFWSDPNPEHEAEATAHLTFEGTRDQYVAGVPDDIAARIPAQGWEQDWRVMSQPGRLDTQRALVADYGRYVERFDAVADYLAHRQPPSLLLWGRHDSFFALAEVLSWLEVLPRMEAHVLDGSHFLLETQAAACSALMLDFIERVEREDVVGSG